MNRTFNRHHKLCSLGLLGTLLISACSPDISIKIPDAVNYSGSGEVPNNSDAIPIPSQSGDDRLDSIPDQTQDKPSSDPVETSPAPEVVTAPTPTPAPAPTEPVVTPPVVTTPVVPPPVVTPPATPAPVQAIANGNYTIKGVSSNKCIDVNGGQTWDGLQMSIWDCVQGENNQLFKIEWVEGSYYRISTSANKAIEGRKGALIVGSPVQQGTYSGEAHQLFAIEAIGTDGQYYLKNKGSNLVVDLAGDFRSNGSYLQFASPVAAGYQKWTLTKK